MLCTALSFTLLTLYSTLTLQYGYLMLSLKVLMFWIKSVMACSSSSCSYWIRQILIISIVPSFWLLSSMSRLNRNLCKVPTSPAGQGSVRGCKAPSAATGFILSKFGHNFAPDCDRMFPCLIPRFDPEFTSPFTRLLKVQNWAGSSKWRNSHTAKKLPRWPLTLHWPAVWLIFLPRPSFQCWR